MSRSKFPALGFFKLQLCFIACLYLFGSVGFSQFPFRERTKSGPRISDIFSYTDKKSGCCGARSKASSFAVLDYPEYETYTLTGTYYSLNNNLTATLMLNNKAPEPVLATPTFYSLSGTRLRLPPITVPAASYMDISLHELLAGAGEEFREGSIKIAYQGVSYQLGCQVKLVDQQKSLIWAEQFVYTSKFVSNKLENVWWLPADDAETKFIVSNTTYSPVSLTIKVDGTVPQQSNPIDIQLNPSETKVLDMMRDIVGHPNGSLQTKGGISITHTGAPGAVLAKLLVSKANRGYSTTLNFVDPETTASRRWHGNGMRLRNLDGGPLRPILIARNTTGQVTTIRGKIPYTKPDGEVAAVNIPDTQIAANSTKLINLHGILSSSDIPASVTYSGIELEYDSAKGSVITSVISVSQNDNHAFQVPMFDPQKTPTSAGGYPWKADGDHSTILYIKNETEEPKKFTAFLNYAGASYSLGIKELKGSQTIAIDFKELRDEQTPDINGNVIPLNLEKGQIAWSVSGGEDKKLSGRSEQISVSGGMSSTYDCRNFCPNSVYQTWVDPFEATETVGASLGFSANQTDINSFGQIFGPYAPDFVSWGTTDGSVAAVDNVGTATAIGVGTANIQGSWETGIWWYDINEFCEFIPTQGNGEAPMEVVGVQKIQYRVNGVWTDIPSGGIGPICNGGEVFFRAVPTSGSFSSGKPVWGGDATGTGAEISVAFYDAGERTVSATSGNTVSVKVKVNPDNTNINVSWLNQQVTTNTSTDPSTTTGAAFVPEYTACADLVTNEWKLRVKKIEGGTEAVIRTGGYRNASANPPTSQSEAIDANTVMNNYYTSNAVGGWHTPSATQAHENYHDLEWRCAGNHYWGPTEVAIEALRASYTTYATEADAINHMRTMTNGVNAKITAFFNATDDYWGSLPDGASSRPHAAGQLILNDQISAISNLATTNGWLSVPGVANANPSTANPCHLPFGTYNP